MQGTGAEVALSDSLSLRHTHRLGHVNDWDLALSLNLLLLVLGASLGGDKSPETVDVDDWAEVHVLGLVEVTHTDLTEVTRVTAQQEKVSDDLVLSTVHYGETSNTALLLRGLVDEMGEAYYLSKLMRW